MKTNRLICAGLAILMLVACFGRYADPIEQYTREYVAGRISAQRYHDLCRALNAGQPYPPPRPASSTSSESTSSETSDSSKDDKKHGRNPHPPPPPGTAPPPPPGTPLPTPPN